MPTRLFFSGKANMAALSAFALFHHHFGFNPKILNRLSPYFVSHLAHLTLPSSCQSIESSNIESASGVRPQQEQTASVDPKANSTYQSLSIKAT